jgi:hypothetical protein
MKYGKKEHILNHPWIKAVHVCRASQFFHLKRRGDKGEPLDLKPQDTDESFETILKELDCEIICCSSEVKCQYHLDMAFLGLSIVELIMQNPFLNEKDKCVKKSWSTYIFTHSVASLSWSASFETFNFEL